MTPQERLAQCEQHAQPWDDEGALLSLDVPWMISYIKQLRQALEFYAEYDNYRGFDDGTSRIGDDAGERARAALATMPDEVEPDGF